MKQSPCLTVICAAVVSVVLFSGQMTRPYAPPLQQQTTQRQPAAQRQSAATVQQRVIPPKPATTQTPPAAQATAEEMPSLFWLPEDVQFPELPVDAARTITFYGDPKKAELFVTRTLIPKGVQTIPHFHPDSRTVTVMSGVCYYGRGEEFDESRTIPMPSGSFFTEPAGVPHFIWAKDGDVVVQTTAIGPSGTQIVREHSVR